MGQFEGQDSQEVTDFQDPDRFCASSIYPPVLFGTLFVLRSGLALEMKPLYFHVFPPCSNQGQRNSLFFMFACWIAK